MTTSAPLIRRFVSMLELLNRGRFVEKCDEQLAGAIAALEALPNEKGKATMNITIELSYESGKLEIKPIVKTKLPEDKAFPGTACWAHEGAISLQHPSQVDLFAGPREAPRERDAI